MGTIADFLRARATGPVQPTRARVSIRVERGPLKPRHTLALLAPASSAAVICSMRSRSSAGGRPTLPPRPPGAPRAATHPPPAPGRRQAGHDPLAGERPLVLGQSPEDREQELALRGGGVHPLGQGAESD